MILVWDLGFLCSLVVVVVGWLVGRRKWRRVVARKEEIRRLMLLASEETARAEQEAAVGYGSYGSVPPTVVASAEEPEPVIGAGSPPARQVQHHCEVCFSPTTTRCKQCKAVRYCSKKCQIIHWREGHKDECHSFVSHRNIDSQFKEIKQDEIRSSQNVAGADVMHANKPTESHSEAHLFSDPIPHVLDENNGSEAQTSDHWKKTGINLKESVQSLPVDSSSPSSSVDVVVTLDSNLKDCDRVDRKSSTINAESVKPLLSKQSKWTNPEYGAAASSGSNQLKSGSVDIDEMSDSRTSSGCVATNSEGHLFTKPSTPVASDFWGGSVKSIRSEVNELGDGSADFNILHLHSAKLRSSGRINPHVETLASNKDRAIRNDSSPSTSIPNKSHELSELNEDDSACLQFSGRVVETLDSGTKTVTIDGPCQSTSVPNKSTESSELSENDLKSRGMPHLRCKLPSQDSVGNTGIGRSSTEEAKISSSGSHRHASEGDDVITKQGVSKLQSLALPKKLDCVVDGPNGNLDAVKENGSSRLSVSKARSSSVSCSAKSISDAQQVQNEFIHMDASFASSSSCHLRCAKSGTSASTRKVVGQLRASSFNRNGSLGPESGIKGQNEGGLFSYEHFVKLYNWNKIELYPCGLMNCGNSCYANSVLQCLAFTPPLTAYFLQGLHAKACKVKEWCFTCELEVLVKKAKEGNALLSPTRIMSQMQCIGHNLANGREEDAHEFLRYAIEAMQSVCLKETEVKMPSSLNEETSLLGLTFGGYLQSKIECLGCGGKSKQSEKIMDLSVEIGGEISSLEDALRQFTRSEILDGENKYKCGRCLSYQKAKKKLRVLEAPNVLTIALKRFQSGKYGKLNKAVKFPEILNLAKYMSETSDKSPIYQLYGVVVHLDIMNSTFSGHYVCYLKNNQGRWYKADDSVVQRVEIEKVLSQDAYMLFYSRCSPRAPRPIRNTRIEKRPREHLPCKPRSCLEEPWHGSSCNPCPGCVPQNHTTYRPTRSNSSEESDSSIFSEVRSCSTDSSSNGESTSTSDNFDQMLVDTSNCWHTHGRSTSDSDATSSASSSPSSAWSSPHPRHSPLANMDRYSSDTETSSHHLINVCSSSQTDSDGFWAGGSSSKKVRGQGNGCKARTDNNDRNNRLGSHSSRDDAKGVYI